MRFWLAGATEQHRLETVGGPGTIQRLGEKGLGETPTSTLRAPAELTREESCRFGAASIVRHRLRIPQPSWRVAPIFLCPPLQGRLTYTRSSARGRTKENR